MTYYSAVKRHEILIISWNMMKLDNIMFSEIYHTQKKQMLFDSTYLRVLQKLNS